MKILKYIPAQLVFFLILGIVLGYYLELTLKSVSILLIISLLLLSTFYFVSRKKGTQSYYFTIATYAVFMLIGIASITFKNPQFKENNYSNFFTENVNETTLVIDDILKDNNYYNNYIATVISTNGNQSQGKIKLNIQKDSTKNILSIDDKIIVFDDFEEIDNPKNPYQFNYKNYLAKQQVQHQMTIYDENFLRLKNEKTSLKGLAHSFRKKINLALEEHGFKGDELAIINALLLGQRQEISKEIIENYQNAGAIHILAVSGLHVGIILLLLNFLFKPLERLKNGKVIKLVIVVFSLWTFAFLAGLSASVIRAVTMFTAVAVALATKKEVSTYKTLLISIFFLLLFNPFYLFEVGFQLSYLAVFFIVWVQPQLYNLWQPNYKVIDYPWQLFTVSVAAQLGVLPLSLYYFHQFPGLFFVANLLIIPFLGLILGLGILVIILSLMDILPNFIASLYEQVIFLLNSTVGWIGKQESFLFQNISFTIISTIISYLIIITFFKWFETKNRSLIKYVLIVVILFQSNLIFEKYQTNTSSEFVIFNKSRYSMLVKKDGNKASIQHNLDSITNNTIINDFLIGTNSYIKSAENKIENMYQLESEKLIVIDSFGIYKNLNFKPEIIWLINSPNINLQRLINEIEPKKIIADASNYKSHVLLWQKTSKNNNIPFHYTVKDGAFIKKL
ncbi:ComEC/Rec2 family competence protein [Aureibaculum sp. 2210JD6-5]|uniref:ComEC/Rec2 family competence protein n=1 Tax=Aureibaculum sp. 2210JD6-5 TaxID=3103957 RepID=UPI002AAC6194|nr:ComEC/Rec2 family competence protein [Aureibaculum sp. 2210JD6-5]MDY7394603.1 ComEC/Rec2 family competence protein [Aureibaculum sp. 2210JD6-5]